MITAKITIEITREQGDAILSSLLRNASHHSEEIWSTLAKNDKTISIDKLGINEQKKLYRLLITE